MILKVPAKKNKKSRVKSFALTFFGLTLTTTTKSVARFYETIQLRPFPLSVYVLLHSSKTPKQQQQQQQRKGVKAMMKKLKRDGSRRCDTKI